MKKETRIVIIVSAILVIIVALLRVTGYWKSNFDRSADPQVQANIIEAPQYIALRAELEKVEKGDFVEYDGKWNVVTGVKFISKGSKENGIAVCGNYQVSATQIYYNVDIGMQRIGRVVRWHDENFNGMTIPPTSEIRWKATAREFFGVQ